VYVFPVARTDVVPAPPSVTTRRDAPHWGYQPALDGLRAIAVLAVIAFHDGIASVSGGFLGVDVFFVLSGFLITSLLVNERQRGGRIDFRAFWARRARRLLPALFLLLTVIGVYASMTSGSALPDAHNFRLDGLASLFYVANWRFAALGQAFFASLSPFRHLWSLAIEEQFYLVWPLVVAGCLRAARGSLRLLTVTCIVGTVVSITLSATLYSAHGWSRVYYGTDTRAHELLIGALLAVLLASWSPGSPLARGVVRGLGFAGAAACLWAFHGLGEQSASYYRGLSAVFAVCVAAVIASAVQPGPHVLRGALSVGALRWIGRISYGLYLWHWPVDVYLYEGRAGLHGPTLDVLRLAITFAIATVSFYALERPVRSGAARRAFVRFGAPAGVLCAALALVVGASMSTPSVAATGTATTSPTPCSGPSALSLASAASYVRRTGVQVDPLPTRMRVAVVGDTAACSLLAGLTVLGEQAGVSVEGAAVAGCSPLTDGIGPAGASPRETQRCDSTVHALQAAVLTRGRPDLVVWYSGPDIADQRVGRRVVRFGTPDADALLLARMDAALARLTGGARLVIVTNAPDAAVEHARPPDAARTAAILHLDALYRDFAARHPGRVVVADLVPVLCPGGPPCPRLVQGVVARPVDGVRLDGQGSVIVARWLVPELASIAAR